MRAPENLDAFFIVEAGLIAYYEFEEGRHRLRYRTRRLAVVFDSDTANVLRIGLPEVLMSWAASRRQELRERGEHRTAGCLEVSMLPREHEVDEYNRLQAEPSYGITFLRKAGLV